MYKTFNFKNETEELRIAHVTHNDLDAVGCDVIAELASDVDSRINIIETKFADISEVNDTVNELLDRIVDGELKTDMILITDISVNDDTASRLDSIANSNGIELVMLDHHMTNHLPEIYEWAQVVVRDGTELVSATWAVYNYFKDVIGNSYPSLMDFAKSVSRYDTWEWKRNFEDGSEEDLNILFRMFHVTEASSVFVNIIAENNFPVFMMPAYFEDIVEAYKYRREESLVHVVDNTVRTVFYDKNNKPYNVGIIIPHEEFFNAEMSFAYEQQPELDFIIGLGPRKRTISLRTSKPDVNVGIIAKETFDGGGHAAAAGGRPGHPLFVKLITEYYDGMDGKVIPPIYSSVE